MKSGFFADVQGGDSCGGDEKGSAPEHKSGVLFYHRRCGKNKPRAEIYRRRQKADANDLFHKRAYLNEIFAVGGVKEVGAFSGEGEENALSRLEAVSVSSGNDDDRFRFADTDVEMDIGAPHLGNVPPGGNAAF